MTRFGFFPAASTHAAAGTDSLPSHEIFRAGVPMSRDQLGPVKRADAAPLTMAYAESWRIDLNRSDRRSRRPALS
ncbi:hypothetical protein [Amycolatopsis benzoatilytica]|uniref:hypothetical protein n=1 Tax=Amycolatopsis benzoatilytica TaxID=346045 RepID=UPI000375D705|nr:hypothetical protein [Amycolatopsis benzoatilytica]